MNGSPTLELTKLYEEYKDMVYRVCLRFKKGDSDWAADRMQEVFLKLTEKWNDLPEISNYKAFIYRITVNTCINHLRREKKLIEIFTKFFLEDTQIDSVRGVQIKTPEHSGADSEALHKIDRALSLLPPKQRAVVIMYYFEDIDIPAIAEILQVNKGTVSRRLKSARQKLAEILNEEEFNK